MTSAPPSRPGPRRIAFALLIVLAAALDLWSKSEAFARIGSPQRGHFYLVIPKILQFETAMNPGIAWSLLSERSARWFIAGLSIVALPVIIGFFLNAKSPSWLFTVALSFIAGGTIGNLHDRLAYAAVRDFIRVLFIDFPVFNVADSFICVGAVLVAVEGLFAGTPEEKASESAAEKGIVAANRAFYDKLWSGTKMVLPERFNTWPLIEPLAAAAPNRLEVGPGMRPRSPIKGTQFVDLSAAVVDRLNALGGIAKVGQATPLPFPDRHFNLVCAFDIIEHTEDGEATFAELARVLKPGGVFIFSVPLFMAAWNFFDDAVGHARRYEPEDLAKILARCGFTLEKSAAYGMQPSSPLLLKLGIWWVRNRYDDAMAWYNRVFFPLALRFQKPLKFGPGMLDTKRVDEAIFVCRRIA